MSIMSCIYENISRKRDLFFLTLQKYILIAQFTELFLTNVFGLVSIDRGGRLPSINFISE